MPFDPDRHHRRSIRLHGYDYTRYGVYFITICEVHRECLFGEGRDGKVRLNEFGEIVREEWLRTPTLRPYVHLEEFIVMPNHFHGILVVDHRAAGVGATRASPCLRTETRARHVTLQLQNEMPHGPKPGSVGSIVGSFKSAVSRRINAVRDTPGSRVFQRDYYDHIIHGGELQAIARYIRDNPRDWLEDPDNFTIGNIPTEDYWHHAGLA